MNKMLMRKYILMAISCYVGCGHFQLNAQPTGFSKTYFFEERSTLFHAVRQFDEKLLIYGQMGADEFDNNGVFVALLDTLGSVHELRIFQDPNNEYNLDLSNGFTSTESITIHNSQIYLTGMIRFFVDLFMICLDENMNFVFFKQYESSFQHGRYVSQTEVFDEAIYTIGIGQTINVDHDLFIHKSDMAGNQIWEKTIGIPEHNEVSPTMIIENDEIILLYTDAYDPSHLEENDDIRINKMIRLDTSGQIIEEWSTQINKEGWSTEALLFDGSFYYYITRPGIVDDIGNIHFKPQIVCRDQNFNLKWRKDYGEFYFFNVFTSMTLGPDGFLYAAGYIPDGVTYGRVCKIDPENGDVVWDARDTAFVIPGWGSRNRMEGVTVLPSGSVIAVGYTMDPTFHENGLLYKITKDGCIDTLCTSVAIQDLMENPDDRVRIYPNPAIEQITIECAAQEDLIVEIVDAQGRKALLQKIAQGNTHVVFDKNAIAPGLYFWKAATKQGQIVESGKILIGGKE